MKSSLQLIRLKTALFVLPQFAPLLAVAATLDSTTVRVVNLCTEYQTNPLGLDTTQPRLSWQLQAARRSVSQSAYQIRVARSGPSLLAVPDLLWDTGKVNSAESIHQPYQGPALRSGQRYFWEVRVWDNHGQLSGWSDPAYWEIGLLSPADWQASWIEPELAEDATRPNPAPLLRRDFELKQQIASARAYVTSHGLYEMYLNGQRVGDQLFTPGWTSYQKRLQYQTYDVTKQLRLGANAVGVMLGDGWFRGNIGFDGQRNRYGTRLALLLQIRITYRDGHQSVITSDEQWRAATGPLRSSEIYQGETYDARLEQPGWTTAGFDDRQWSAVRLANYPKDNLIAPAGPPVRRIAELKPVKISSTPAGKTVVDFGQNMVGWVRLRAQGPAGTVITLRHAEVLDQQGDVYTDNLRTATQTNRYVLKGAGTETFAPHFTYQGFRYVAIAGYPGNLTAADLTAVVIHSDLQPTGQFLTSNPLINQLQHNILWGEQDNFFEVPTDCPQRDERLGWTGDAQVFAATAAFNMDVAGFFTKWLQDLALDQYENGSVPHVIPDVLSKPNDPAAGSAGWADAAVIIPWTIYLSYGDKQILEKQYPSMARWVEYERQRAGADYLWDSDHHFGDWLAFASSSAGYPGATTGKDFIATAFFAHSCDLLQRIARTLGKRDDAAHYGELFTRIKSAFRREFVTEAGRVGENTQTCYALALQFDLLPENLRAGAAQRLAREVRERGHLTTGFLGTPNLLPALSRFGYLEEAYLLLNRQEYPSWLYPVKHGATTMWERWDGIKPDGTFQDPSMNSFNHYAYGAVGDWMYRVSAGIDIDQTLPGYKHILLQPQPGPGFTSVSASHETMYGRVSLEWKIEADAFQLSVEVPPNTSAAVRLPSAQLVNVTESGQLLVVGNGITQIRQEGSSVIAEIGSGRYQFRYPMKVN